jgi:DNA replication licensing factor MCM5
MTSKMVEHYDCEYEYSFQGGAREKVNVGIRAPYLRVLGIQVKTGGGGKMAGIPATPEEEEEFRRLAASPNIYETVAKSIAPSIFGSLDIKKAIGCLLFGGSRKR